MTAKPLRADARRNRERVLEAARTAFADEGLAVPLDEIARRAGVGAGTVYRHFPTKEALFAAIVAGNLDTQTEWARALATDPDPAGALEKFFREMVEQGVGNRAFTDALNCSGVDVWTTEAARAGSELLDALAALLTRAQQAGVVRQDITAKQVKALLVGVLAAGDWLGGDVQARRQLTEVICAGFRTGAR
ncbi:MAG: TetR family transcriptional regulator [Pseudonocardiaceae bacterium]|nr:TetR family transcriptional regulator [Pseudonocardiaceae bacterium]